MNAPTLLVFSLLGPFMPLATNSPLVYAPLTGRTESTSWHSSYHNKVLDIGTALTLDMGTKYGALGKVLRQAYTLFFDWLNKNHGGLTVGGDTYWVRLHLLDDQSDGDRVENITKHLLTEKGILHFLGPYGSTLTRRAAIVLNTTNAVMVCGCASSTTVFQDRPRMFGVLAIAGTFLIHAFDKLYLESVRSVGYIYEDLAFTRGVCGPVDALAQQRNISVVFGANGEGKFTHDAAGTAVHSLLTTMSSRKPDVLVGCVNADVCTAILQSAAALQFNPKAIVLTICVTTANYGTVTGNSGMFVMGVAPWTRELQLTSSLTGLTVKDLVDLYESTYGDRIVYQAAASFASASTLAYAIQQAGTVSNPDKVAAVLRSMDHTSVFGQIAFDQNGQGQIPVKVVQAQAQSTPVVAPPATATATLMYPKPTFDAITCLNSNLLQVGRHGIYPNGSCLPCNSTEVAPFNASLGFRVCKKLVCPPGQRSWVFTDGAWCYNCAPGYYASTSGATQCRTCDVGRFQQLWGASSCDECAPGKHANSQASIECTECGPGSYNSMHGSSACQRCPTGGFCAKDANGLRTDYTNDFGWFLFDAGGGRKSLIECQHGPDGSACVRGGSCYGEHGQQSMAGPFCGQCRKGFGRHQSSGLCKKCPSTLERIGLVFLQLLVFNMVAFAVFILVLRTDLTKPNKLASVILKQFLNHLTMCRVVWQVTEFRLPFMQTEIVSDVMEVMSFGLGSKSPIFNVLGAYCLASEFAAPHKVSVVVSLLWVPAMVIFLSAAFWAFRAFQTSRGIKLRRSKLITLLVVNLFLVHPRNTELSLSAWRCKQFDKPRLMMDTAVDCQSMSHRLWQLLGLLSFCLYSLGIPFGVFVTLRFYKKKGKLQKKKTINTLGFLYSGFEPEHYYFESLLMLRKILFQLVIEIPQFAAKSRDHDAAIECVSMMLLAVFFLAMHMAYEPYDNRAYFALDRIEAASLWAILITLLVQSWTLLSENAYIFNAADNGDPDNTRWNRDFRDSIGTIVVIFFHAHFFLLICFTAVRPFIIQVTNWKLFDHGTICVEEAGLRVIDADGIGMKLFSSILQELSSLLVDVRGRLTYGELVSCLKYLCVNCAYHRKKERLEQGWEDEDNSDMDVNMTQTVWTSIATKGRLVNMARRLGIVLRLQVYKNVQDKWQKHTKAVRGVVHGDIRDSRTSNLSAMTSRQMAALAQLEDLKHFSPEAVKLCQGERFFIDDLHMAVVRLSRDIEKQNNAIAQSQAACDSRPTTRTAPSVATGKKCLRLNDDDDDGLSLGTMFGSRDFRSVVDPLDEYNCVEQELRYVKAELEKFQEMHEEVVRKHETKMQAHASSRDDLASQIRESMEEKLKLMAEPTANSTEIQRQGSSPKLLSSLSLPIAVRNHGVPESHQANTQERMDSNDMELAGVSTAVPSGPSDMGFRLNLNLSDLEVNKSLSANADDALNKICPVCFKRIPLTADRECSNGDGFSAVQTKAIEVHESCESQDNLGLKLELQLRNEELEDQNYRLNLELDTQNDSIKLKDIALKESEEAIAKLRADIAALQSTVAVESRGNGSKDTQVLGRKMPTTPRTPRKRL